MVFSMILPIYALVLWILFKVVSFIVENRKHAARAKELGCQDAPQYPDEGFLGLNNVKAFRAADAQKLFPDHLIDRRNVMTKHTGRPCSTYRMNMLGQTVHMTSDPKNIQAILATQFADFDLGPTRHGIMVVSLGDGIFVQDGKPWEHSRAMLRPQFVRDQVSDLELEERHVQNLLQVVPVHADGWTGDTDIQTLFFRLTIDSASEFLFGESVDSQLADTQSKATNETAFSKNFDSATWHMGQRFRLADMYWLHNPKVYRDNNRAINDFAQHYVDLALSTGSLEKTEDGRGKQKYVFLEALAQQTRDPEEIRAQLLNILLAGRDTTASLLSWFFHELLRHPDIYAKLRSTIVTTFGTYDHPTEITFATLKDCQYLRYCLNETLRLWPVVPGNVRRANKPTTLPRGGGPDGQAPIYLKSQSDVQYSVHVMQRRKDLWGEDAGEFRPERFDGLRTGWEYLPFNGGPRICIGQQFALTEASYVVVRLLQKFDRIEPGAQGLEGPVRQTVGLTSCPGNLVTLRLHVAQE